jgi:hypothetical protein
MLELGKKGRDKITGFEGIIIGYAKYLYGCNTYGLMPKVGSDGQLRTAQWFDEWCIEIIGDGINPTDVRAKKHEK